MRPGAFLLLIGEFGDVRGTRSWASQAMGLLGRDSLYIISPISGCRHRLNPGGGLIAIAFNSLKTSQSRVKLLTYRQFILARACL